MRFLYLLVSIVAFLGVLAGCGGGASTVDPNPEIIPGEHPEPTDPGSPDIPVDPGSEEDPAEPEPELPELPQSTNWQEYGLLPMDESLIVPDDVTLPEAYVFGISEGDVVFGDVDLSILATDNIGVNQVVLFLNNQIIETLGVTSLQYTWETTNWDDGDYRLGILLRDDGNNYAMIVVNAVVDNTSDLQGPEISVTSVSSTADGQTVEYALRPIRNNTVNLLVCGVATISIYAADASEISRISTSYRTSTGIGWSDWKTLGESSGNSFEFDWNTLESDRWNQAIARAEDVHGNVTELKMDVYVLNEIYTTGQVVDGEDQFVEGAEIFVMPAVWELSDGNVEVEMLDLAITDYRGRFVVYVPIGSSKLLIRSGEKTKVISQNVPPVNEYYSIYLTIDQTRLE